MSYFLYDYFRQHPELALRHSAPQWVELWLMEGDR
jgi:hypothetical protein